MDDDTHESYATHANDAEKDESNTDSVQPLAEKSTTKPQYLKSDDNTCHGDETFTPPRHEKDASHISHRDKEVRETEQTTKNVNDSTTNAAKKNLEPTRPPQFKGLCEVLFYYLHDIESARVFLHKHLPSNIRIIQENPIDQGERQYGDCSKSFQATLDVMENTDMHVLETLLSNAWLSYHSDLERMSWLEFRHQDKSFYRIQRMHSVTSFQNVLVTGGSMTDPSTFINHWSLTSSSYEVIFEHDKGLLSVVSKSLINEDEILEVPYDSIVETILVSREKNTWHFYFSLKHVPFVYKRKTTSTRRGKTRVQESRQVSINGISRFSLSQTSAIRVSIHKQISNDGDSYSVWNIILRLKWRGFSLSYVRISEKNIPNDNTWENLCFNNFDVMYTWKCLLSCGFKVSDHIDEEVIDLIKTNESNIHPDLFLNLITKAERNPFYDFKGAIKESIQKKSYSRASVDKEKDELPSNYSMVRRVVVTPTAEIFLRKEPTIQNRITRQYDDDYFIRVVFRDEDFSRISATLPDNLDPIIERYQQFMDTGFTIGDRKYEFLACSNSQLREHGVWFFSKYGDISAEDIRCKSGDLSDITCIATYVSRLGLCFSASKDTVDVTVEEGSVTFKPDVKRNDYCFTDGIGTISCNLAKKVADKLEIHPVPSAFQIRYGGCKGVLSQDPNLGDKDMIVIRDSMKKFESASHKLEILQTTQPGQLYLNRQVITLMSGLDVPDHKFLELQEKMLFNMADIMLHDDKAMKALSEVSIGVKYKSLTKSGIILTRDPFFRSILMTLYKCKLGELIRKSRIEIPFNKGRIMMGVVDETGLLKYGEVFVSYSKNHDASHSGAVVHTGTVVVAKNPCFHPGDLRKLKAVDIQDLHHLIDCIVFPQNGHRPHSNEMSGSDLDGDMYFVCWDENLLPPGENKDPMEFPGALKETLVRSIQVTDVTSFIAKYIKHDQLGVIANAHVVHADLKNISCRECLELSLMHSDAVDFPKTGKSPKMNKDLRVEKYPDFMSKRDKPIYRSTKVLGKLFRECRSLEQAQLKSQQASIKSTPIIVDQDLIYPGYENYLDFAHVSHNSYSEKIFQLMSLYGIETEAEVVTGVISKLVKKRGYLQNERFEIGQIVKAKMSVVRKRTREDFFQEFGGEEKVLHLEKIDSTILAKASSWYKAAYTSPKGDTRILSFPWIVGDILSRIKLGEHNIEEGNVSKHQCKHSVLSQIGTSLLRQFDMTTIERHNTFLFLQETADEIANLLKKSQGIDVFCLGMLPLNLLDPNERTIYLFIKGTGVVSPEFFLKNVPTDSVFVSARGNMVTLRKRRQSVCVNFSSKENIKDYQRTMFALQQITSNPIYALIIHFMLDWGRKKKIVGRYEPIFGDLTFVTLILELISVSSEDVISSVDIEEHLHIEPHRLQWLSFNHFPKEETTKAAKILLSILRSFSSILKQDEKGNILIPLLDPSDPLKGRRIIDRPLQAILAKRVLDQVLYAYQYIIKCNSVDSFFDNAVLEDDHMIYNLPLDTWGSIMFAETYTEKRLSESTGALVSIRRTQFRDTPGILLEARGSPDQLWNVHQSLNELGERSSNFITTLAREQSYIHGAYQCLFEGAIHRDQRVSFENYLGGCQHRHHEKILRIPYIDKCIGISTDIEMFKNLIHKQMRVVKNDYDSTYHGVLRLALTFGVFYLTNAENEESMTIEQLETELHKITDVETNRAASNIKGRGRGRGKGRGRHGYLQQIQKKKKIIRSCFMPKECKLSKVNEFLNSSEFKLNDEDFKYHVTFKFGAPDYGKRHEGQVILDSKFCFVEFRLSDLKWLAADISRGFSNYKKLMDVRCKLDSRRTVDIETVQQIDDVKSLLEPTSGLLKRYDNRELYVATQYHDRVTFIRQKEIRSYQYDGAKSDESIWHDMKIEVCAVTEYSKLDSSGRFLDVVMRNEVTVIPKFPSIEEDMDDSVLISFAEKVWKLIGKLGKQFDD